MLQQPRGALPTAYILENVASQHHPSPIVRGHTDDLFAALGTPITADAEGDARRALTTPQRGERARNKCMVHGSSGSQGMEEEVQNGVHCIS
jgi:hypothetical protein